MNVEIPKDVVRVIILDISGVYATIHNEGYFCKDEVDCIRMQYKDDSRWMVIVIE